MKDGEVGINDEEISPNETAASSNKAIPLPVARYSDDWDPASLDIIGYHPSGAARKITDESEGDDWDPASLDIIGYHPHKPTRKTDEDAKGA